MLQFAQTCESIAATPAKNEKVRRLAEYLRTLDDADLEAAVRFFTGNPFAQREQRSLSLGGSTIVTATKHVWGVTDAQLGSAYREHGDLGAALCGFARPPVDLGLFTETLTPASLHVLFQQVAQASGKAAGKKRLVLCERILGSCRDPLEAKYVIKIMTGDLRIGLREGLVVEAVAAAFTAGVEHVRRAVMASSDIGSVAVAARHGSLHGVRIAYGVPIGFMLASPIPYGGSYRELEGTSWIVEDKFDGIRAQAHKYGEQVRLFSRTLNDISHTYPEVVQALQAVEENCIIDGELIARRDGHVLPFRYLQARLQRKAVTPDLVAEVPVAFMCFDILAAQEDFLLDEPLLERRKRLSAIVARNDSIDIAASDEIHSIAATEIERRFESARARGHEGLVLKRTDSPYHPGRRGKWWLKLKRELSTLDVVVVAVEWGHGKRAKVLSDYTFAVRGKDGALLTIGKAYSGLTDAEIAELTQWFLSHAIAAGSAKRSRGAIPVEPKIVLEVAFDIIQPSELHESGFALRFPRIVCIRDDKPSTEIDTIDRVNEIYQEMLAREHVQH